MGRNYPVYGSHAYAEGHFIHVGIQCFLVLETRHHRLVLCVESGTHTADQLLLSPILVYFSIPTPPTSRIKEMMPIFQLLDRNRKSPSPAMGTAMADRVPDINRP